MAISPLSPDTVTGRVVSVNPKGVRLDGHDDWFNFSRFAGDIVPPMRGQTVTLTLDRQGYIRSVDAAGDVAILSTSRQAPGAARDRTITRLAVLKAAAEFAAARPQLKSRDVMTIATSWERWVTRETDAAEELTDARSCPDR